MIQIRSLLLIMALLLSLTCSLTITSVTLQNAATTTALQGSLMGGTKLYIQGLGFSQTMSENIIYVGQFPCMLEDGATATSMVCSTSKPDEYKEYFNLPIVVIVGGANNFMGMATAPQTYSYVNGQTPYINSVTPSVSYGGTGTMLYFLGSHRIIDLGDDRNFGDIYGIYIGDSICSRLGISQEPITPNGAEYIQCYQATLQKAGKYQVSEHMFPGRSVSWQFTYKATLNNQENFQFVVLPFINDTTHFGSANGRQITVKGTGFSLNKNDVSVSVDGVDCKVSQSSLTEVKCQLQSRTTQSAQLQTNATQANMTYNSGVGFFYQRFRTGSITLENFKRGLENGSLNSGHVVAEYISGEIKTDNIFGANYGQLWKGYFKPTVTGGYKFRGLADDFFAVYLSQTYGSTVSFVGVTPIAFSSVYQAFSLFPNYYLNDIPTAESEYIEMEAGKQYYMEVYHVNNGGTGRFSLSVEVPNNDTTVQKWQTYEVQTIATSSNYDPQIIDFISTGATQGNITLAVLERHPTTFAVTTNISATFSYDATASQFCSQLRRFSWYNTYTITCERTMRNDLGDLVTESVDATTFVWRVFVEKFRPLSAINRRFTSITYTTLGGQFTITPVQDHSPLVSGTFRLSLGGAQVNIWNGSSFSNPNIPFNVPTSTLSAAIKQLTSEFSQLRIQLAGDPTISARWMIYYAGYNKDVPDIQVVNMLTGGKSGQIPTIVAQTRRNYTSNLFVDPIDYRWMRTYSDKPNVIVTVDGIPSACHDDCTYTFIQNLPVVTGLNLTDATLNFNISDPDSSISALNKLTITIDGQDCVNLTGTTTEFTCDLPKNLDNTTPILTAGNHLPTVTLSSIGILKYNETVEPITIDLTLDSVNNSSSILNGGVEVTVVGKGLPLTSSEVVFTLCEQRCDIKQLSNTKAKIVVPTCDQTGNSALQVTFNGLAASVAFQYLDIDDTLQINSISPNSWSPVMKGVMEINGAGFGSDPSQLTVYLTNSTGNIYQMKVLTATNTLLKVGIPGGLPGNFEVNVIKKDFGSAVVIPAEANDFAYEVVITNVSPSEGSIGGGTLITITGMNFVADPLDTLVTIGNQLNQICKIQSITTTQIKCRTPPKNFYYNVSVPQEITVDSKLIMPTNCSNGQNCWFSYVGHEQSPVIYNASSKTISTGLPLIITGERFSLSATPQVSFTNRITGKVTVATPSVVNDTSLTVTVPAIEAGLYAVRVRTDPLGESNMTALTVSLNINSVSVSGLSTFGGNIKILGSGFPQTWPNQHYNRMSISTSNRNIPINVVSMTTNQIVLTIPPGPSGRSYSFSLTSPTLVPRSISFSHSTNGTPKIALVDSAQIDPNTETLIRLNQTNTQSSLASVLPERIQIYSISNPKFVINIPNTYEVDGGVISFNVTLNTGKYGFRLFDEIVGWYDTTDVFITVIKTMGQIYTLDQVLTKTSFNGGTIKINGPHIGDGAVVIINGFKGPVVERTDTYAVFEVPKLVTKQTQTKFKLVKEQKIDLSSMTKFADSTGFENAFDGVHATTYLSTSDSQCHIGVDIGENLGVQISRIRYFPNPFWRIASLFIQGATVQVSNDNTNWQTIATVDSTVHAGWNSFMITNKEIYRYVKFSHNSVSKCNISEFEINGVIMSTVTVASTDAVLSDVHFDDGISDNFQTFAGAIEYANDTTPIVSDVTPDKGDVFGGYNITIKGEYLDLFEPTVMIDAVPCVVKDKNSTQIICTVGQRLSLPEKVFFEVQVGGIPAIVNKKFRYVMRWSDHRTWGTDLPPIDDDLVYVPPGMHLLVDETTPILEGIIVENGTIEFSNERDMVVSAEFITLRGGEFIAGTEEDDYDYKLTFVMYGNYYSPQQPMFGNKGIGCLECKFSMIGKKRTPTWTLLNKTVNADENIIVVKDEVDWKKGEHIVIASTSYNHNEAEQRVIVDVINQTVIVLDKPLRYEHYAGIQNYGSDVLEMRAEVGLLTRNIVMMGDETSVATDYGSHLMLTGSAENGLVGKIAYTEFTKCGQPQIMGRYCHHFHMAGDVPDSYSIGNSVHHSMARILTIHGVHFLYVAWNVGYRVKGHNFFIEDGIETNNVLEYNLAISSLLVNNMMQTDMSVASFWITNPTNHLRFNRAAGSDFYGYWYQIKERPDGPSATEDVCPIGNPLGESHDNVAHSNVRFGLRIFMLYSRQNPCEPIRNDRLQDPWSENPSIESKFYNYQLWKNGEAGLLAQETGNMIFENFTIAESKMAGMQFYKTNFTKERVIARNIAIIGVSIANPPNSMSHINGMKGAILSRTGEQTLSDIRFYSFPQGSSVWQACSKCDEVKLYTNTGAQYFAQKILYSQSIMGNYYKMMGEMKRQVFYDMDGSLTGTKFDGKERVSATLTNGWAHILQDPECQSATNASLWDSAALCNETTVVRQVMFTNLLKESEFTGQKIRIRMLKDGVEEVTSPTQTVFTSELSLQKNKEPKIEKKFSYSFPYLTGRTYEIWWGTRIDFSHLAMSSSHHFKETDLGIVFKFKYIDNRQLYEIAPLRNGRAFNNTLMKLPSSTYLNHASCGNGDYYHNNADDVRVLHLCASGKNRTFFQYIDVNAIYCRNLCPAPPGSCKKESNLRYWSIPTQWPGQVLPKAGDDITIPCEWTIIMDMNPVRMGYFEIKGDVIIPNTTVQDITIEAQNIWIRGGSFKAGSSQYPLNTKLTIRLLGVQNATGFTVSPDLTGNKMLVNTGNLQLIGVTPGTTWTRMTAFASKGANSIRVASTTGWKVGDELGISPSFTATKEYQKVTITAINSATNVSISPALKFAHYGDANPTIVKSYGTLDMRTGVAHLSRNIRIEAGDDSTWGFTLIQFGYSYQEENETIVSVGTMTLNGVEFAKGGQYDTEEAAVQLKNVRGAKQRTIITKSSFHDCQDMCMHLRNIDDVEITNNVYFSARKYHVLALETFRFTFTNNLMIGVVKRPSIVFSELIACFASYQAINPRSDGIRVTNNLCQGSEGHGYAVPDVNCDDIEVYPFAGNTAGSCQIGWIFGRGSGKCLAARGIFAYSCQIGHIMCPADTVTTIFKNFIMADNGRGLTFRIGGGSDDKTSYLNDSYITAIARPSCTQCYGIEANDCIGNHGIRMLTTGKNGERLPAKFGPNFDVVCKEETIDGKVFIYNVEFDNFRRSYPTLGQCSGNVVFRPHSGAVDITASHHLFNTTCTNCQLDAMAFFDAPNPSHLGWFGGCGDILCTGKNNYLIHDHTGTIFPQKGVLLANNSWIGNNTPACTFYPAMNGHYCADQDFGVLAYQSVAPDFNTRIMWPVYLFFDSKNWTSETNGWMEWAWNGGQPLNKRLGRFISVVKLHKIYNMTFKSMPPEDMTLKFQKRLPEGNASDWIIVMLYYPKPNSIRVEVGGQTIKPISLIDNEGENPLNTSMCGSNKFFYKNYTVHFVVTGEPNCMVRVSLTNSIQLTARFEMSINDFFRDDGVTKFINRMAALLRINDTSRIKVVGVYQGSVEVVTYIEPAPVPLTASTIDMNSAQQTAVAQIKQIVSDVINNGDFASGMQQQGFGNVAQVSATVINFVPIINQQTGGNVNPPQPDNPTGPIDPSNPTDPNAPSNGDQEYFNENSQEAQQRTTKIIIGVVLGGTCAVCIAVLSTVFYMRKKVKIGQISMEELQQMESESQHWEEVKANQKVILQQNQSTLEFGMKRITF